LPTAGKYIFAFHSLFPPAQNMKRKIVTFVSLYIKREFTLSFKTAPGIPIQEIQQL
jgi:hypothetical protein